MSDRTCPCCGGPIGDKPDLSILDSVRLSPQQRVICNELARKFGKWVRTETLIIALFAADPNGGPLNVSNHIAVLVHYLRKRLASTGFEIELGRSGAQRRMVWAASQSLAA